jgi:hypothetical protein
MLKFAFLIIFALLAPGANAGGDGYNPTDINNCSYETFQMARKRMSFYKQTPYSPKSNPCAATPSSAMPIRRPT